MQTSGYLLVGAKTQIWAAFVSSNEQLGWLRRRVNEKLTEN